MTPIILLLTFCTMAVIPSVVPDADAQTVATASNCYRTYRWQCFVDSDLPERNGPSRHWDWVETNGYITTSISDSNDNNVNWARWEFEADRRGSHRVLCYISEDWGLADSRYRIYVDGELEVVDIVDQSEFADTWVVLDDFFVPSRNSEVEVRLGDRSRDPAGLDIFVGRCRLYLGGGLH